MSSLYITNTYCWVMHDRTSATWICRLRSNSSSEPHRRCKIFAMCPSDEVKTLFPCLDPSGFSVLCWEQLALPFGRKEYHSEASPGSPQHAALICAVAPGAMCWVFDTEYDYIEAQRQLEIFHMIVSWNYRAWKYSLWYRKVTEVFQRHQRRFRYTGWNTISRSRTGTAFRRYSQELSKPCNF